MAATADVVLSVADQFPPGTEVTVHHRAFDAAFRDTEPVGKAKVTSRGEVHVKGLVPDAHYTLKAKVTDPLVVQDGRPVEQTRLVNTVAYSDRFHNATPEERVERNFTNLQEIAERDASTQAAMQSGGAKSPIDVNTPSSPAEVPDVTPPKPEPVVDTGQLLAQQQQASRDINVKSEAEAKKAFGAGIAPTERPERSETDAGRDEKGKGEAPVSSYLPGNPVSTPDGGSGPPSSTVPHDPNNPPRKPSAKKSSSRRSGSRSKSSGKSSSRKSGSRSKSKK